MWLAPISRRSRSASNCKLLEDENHIDFLRVRRTFSKIIPAIDRPFPTPGPSPMKYPARCPFGSVRYQIEKKHTRPFQTEEKTETS